MVETARAKHKKIKYQKQRVERKKNISIETDSERKRDTKEISSSNGPKKTVFG
jgi:hypothetical protein